MCFIIFKLIIVGWVCLNCCSFGYSDIAMLSLNLSSTVVKLAFLLWLLLLLLLLLLCVLDRKHRTSAVERREQRLLQLHKEMVGNDWRWYLAWPPR